MRVSTLLSATMATLHFAQASYRAYGTIQQYTNTCTLITTFLPSIYLEVNGAQICDGHLRGEEENPYQPDFTPGGVPTNSTHAGPWSGANCTAPYTNVEVSAIGGQVLIRDYETAFWVNPDALNWQQPATGNNLAGIPCMLSSWFTFDSGVVH